MKRFFLFLICVLFGYFAYSSVGIFLGLRAWEETLWYLKIYDRRGELLTQLSGENGYSEPYTGSLDTPLVQGILTIEDKRFFDHYGVDTLAKLSSLYENIRRGDLIRWGSTITEQYIKNRYFPSENRDIWQKIREAWWATIAELALDKEDILRDYLSSVYMGNGLYGVETASRAYFGKWWVDLDEKEIVEIITRIHSPNPSPNRELYRKIVAEKLYPGLSLRGEEQDYDGYKKIDTFPLLTERIKKELSDFCSGKSSLLELFVEEIPRNICLSKSKILYTTLDKALMKRWEELIEWTLKNLEEKNVENASILIYEPRSKKIRAYLANRPKPSDTSSIDMITKKRSVWSLLKPLIYLIALKDGYDGSSLILDDTKVYQTEDREKNFVSQNYIPKSYGPVTLAEALWNSLNSATVRLTETLGIWRVYDALRRAGIDLDHESSYYGYGIGIWAIETSLENIVMTYGNIGNSGEDGPTFLLWHILADEKNRSKTFGISSILNTSLPLAVKTGTSTDFRDNWALWYNSDVVIGVWVGNADRTSMQDVSGVSGAGPIFHHIAEFMIQNWSITPEKESLPRGIKESYECLNTLCSQKSRTFTWDGSVKKSRPKENIYYESDFITPLSQEEKKKWQVR